MPIEPMQISPDSNTMVRYSGGTSVLVLDSVGMEQEGAYHCEVMTTTGSSVDSEVAHLTFTGENYTAWKVFTYTLGINQSSGSFVYA